MTEIPRVPWDEFMDGLDWRQGEHVSMIGPTGQGKTTLALALLPRRSYTVVLGTKPRDKTLTSLIRNDGYKRIYQWPPGPTRRRVVLWPVIRRPEDIPHQQEVLDAALRDIYAEGGWCIFVDEVWYLSVFLGMSRLLELFWSQARSLNISFVAATQRPAHVPLMMYSQPTHLFFWKDNDPANLKRLKELGGGLNSKLVAAAIESLRPFEALYLNTRTGAMAITTAPRR